MKPLPRRETAPRFDAQSMTRPRPTLAAAVLIAAILTTPIIAATLVYAVF